MQLTKNLKQYIADWVAGKKKLSTTSYRKSFQKQNNRLLLIMVKIITSCMKKDQLLKQ